MPVQIQDIKIHIKDQIVNNNSNNSTINNTLNSNITINIIAVPGIPRILRIIRNLISINGKKKMIKLLNFTKKKLERKNEKKKENNMNMKCGSNRKKMNL